MKKTEADMQAAWLKFRWPALSAQVTGGPQVYSVLVTFPASCGGRRVSYMSDLERSGLALMCRTLFEDTREWISPAQEMSQAEAELLSAVNGCVEA